MMKQFFCKFVVIFFFTSFSEAEVPAYLKAKYGTVPSASPAPQSYGGIKTKTKTSSSSTKSRIGFKGGCTTAPPTPQNAGLRCSQYSGCRADCIPNYQFPNGATNFFITCENGQWVVQGGIFETLPSCQPICLPNCQNNGICVAPNQCQCPENFSGPYCQFENKPCMNYPVLPMNSRRSCSSKTCTITCLLGHRFPDGSSITSMTCKDGFWLPDRDKWISVPDCQPICDPPCLNGGNCLSLGHCQCPQDFRGPQCQYRTDNCDAKKLQFNGGYNCSGDQVGLSCSLRCPEGMIFDSTPASTYSCLYHEGFFAPVPIPQCIFPDLEPVALPQYNSQNYYKHQNSSSFNMKTLTVNGFPEGSYVPAGHRWDDYNYESNSFITIDPYIHSENIQVVEKVPEPGMCLTWQGVHYKTFDGKIFSFSSTCSYTLLKDSKDNTFNIVVASDPCENYPDCPKIITIFLDTKKYFLKSNNGTPVFSSPKKRLPIPAQLPGLRVAMSAHFVIVSLDSVGAKILWDSKNFLQIEVQESLWNRTGGLCGSSAGNEFTNPNAEVSTSTFATEWIVEEPGNICNDLPYTLGDCGQSSMCLEAEQFCKKLLKDERFAACHGLVDAYLLMNACNWDHVTCRNLDRTVCACETVNAYVRTCSYKEVKSLANWRDEKTCPMRCNGGKVYKPCAPASGQPICGDSVLHEEGTQTCVEGCYCPEGTVLHEDRCITRDQCPCKLRTKIFPPGSEVPKECNTCTCVEGKWVCTQISCGSRCAAIGDPHYVTFDGKKYDFMGQCSYYLVKSEWFSIEAENVACAGAISKAMNFPVSLTTGLPSCTKTVTIRTTGQFVKLKQNLEVVVNGQDLSKIPYKNPDFTIRGASSIFLQVELFNGIVVWWDGVTRVYIDMPANFTEKTRGLCGTFNNNQKDDFLTPENDVEQAVIPFANKWKTSEKCNDIPDILQSHPCSTNIQKQENAEEHCKKIKSELFASCHWMVDPEPFYQDCLYDMCSCGFKISKCLCPTVAAYAEECSRQGAKISWRDSIRECGVSCPSGQRYQVCGNSCTRSCFDVATRSDCKPQCVEGCNCPDGEALDDKGECIPIGECPCHHDGLQFHSGYQEVRPASKGLELCTCVNAHWMCRPAHSEEEKKYPKASDLQSLCSSAANMEFTTCEPVEPVTCKNMHSSEFYSASVCHPGCKCRDGFVLDSSTKKCVPPEECPCHHGGRSYKENETMQDDCNTCKCQNGKWECSERPCSAECSAWGDSHFKTFDGILYDFQGQCDYVLAKGTSGKDSFDISIQNVPCGSLGAACSKSVTIRVKSGVDQDTITLTKDKPLPQLSLKHATIRQKSYFVIVEAADLGLVVNWDRGTRVYVKLDPKWIEKVKGLCGNYNYNGADDFETPSGGTEVSPLVFGDSWKLQSYCPETVDITNTCEERPDRKIWALKKCGVLKSSLFSPCHSEVPVDIFLQNCIFDSCACDQGGDCECLCTALAAYAQECNNRGVPIKWRSQNLCPMQCDERCSNYSPCISTCPTETCDNILEAKSKTCQEETCIEGCAPKPCPSGQIYLNSTLLECVPSNVCKPTCLEINGTVFNEGGLIEGDDCYSCYCSRGHKVCKGAPCTTQIFTTQATTQQMDQLIECQPGWSEWINQDKAKTVKTKKKTDIEPLPDPLILNNLKGGKCYKHQIVDIECRTVKTHIGYKETGLDVECSLERGLVCRSTQKGKSCQDFEIRVLCQCESPTQPPSFCDPLKPHQEHPTDCHIFYHCEDGPEGLHFVEKTCGPSMYFNPVTMVCDWPYAVEEIKPECKQIPQVEEITTPSIQTVPPLIEECPPGQTKEECAIECDRLCMYYGYSIKNSGFCQDGKKCETSCISQKCSKNEFRASNDTCVKPEDCICRSNDGKPVKPGTIYRESDCIVCQCIDNYYTCDQSACRKEENQAIVEAESPIVQEKNPALVVESVPNLIPIMSTVTPPKECEKDHFIDLTRGDQALPNVIFNASSVLSDAFKPEFAKFDSKVEDQSGGSWCPQYSNNLQYLEIDLGQQEPVYGIKIKGSPLYDEYVTSYKVSYSPDGGNFIPVLNKDKLPQVFRGSIDPTTPVQEIFDTPFEAQIVQIHPETWHGGIALRVELIGCGEPSTTTVAFEFITMGSTHSTEPSLMCDDPMGVENGFLSPRQISVSSELDLNHTKSSLKLNDKNSWQPVTNSPTEFIQFDFLEARNLTGLESKGGPNGWVKSYSVKYSHDGKVWNPTMDKNTKKEKVFLANFDSNTPQTNHFELPICAQFLKIVPTKWYDNIQMRVEVFGCFEPYPTISEELVTQTSCSYCPGVKTEPLELNACRCSNNQWWNGENCVSRTECPCQVGHISYPVGTSYKGEDCSECLCKLGGVEHCTPKQCDPCEKGLRSVVTGTCQCSCQPCPDGTTLCPTSDVCINTTLWCNGVQDCPDDEVGCVFTTVAPTQVIEKIVKKCPEIQCPTGYVKKAKKPTKGRVYQSSMFSSSYSKKSYSKVPPTKGGVKKPVKKPKPQFKEQPLQNCTEYVCVSSKPPPKYIHSKKECPFASCPQGYLPVFEKEDFISNNCPEYICNPISLPDAICNVTGRTFSTFDQTEYKYDICSHILVRDLTNDDWQISLKKTCTEKCWKEVWIQHQDNILVLHPDLTANFDGFAYNAEQTKKIGSNSGAFSLSRIGNALLFVSHRFGFWIIWSSESNLKVGVSRKLVGTVDGLCGFFNENPNDDKMKPNGEVARTTAEFGDSWILGDSQSCEAQSCPVHLQNKAWEICQAKHQMFEPCSTVVNKDAFISRCIETTCECLQSSKKNHTAQEECRCKSLQDFVVECLTRNQTVDISDWRTELDCPVSCDSPLVYHDCYQRECEPTCESLADPEAGCPKIPNVCFPGCYCPPGTVKKGDSCISPSNCRDCECNVLPHLQYVTYDDSNFTINANCVYVMSRDANQNHKFQVLITNAPCKNNAEKMCVGKVTILYQGKKIHIFHDALKNKLKLVVNGERIDHVEDIDWAKITESASKHIRINLVDIQVEVSVYFPSLGVSVKAPSLKYGGKLEGLCGDCDGIKNDFLTSSGKVPDSVNEFALSWLYEKLPQNKEMCENKIEDCPPLKEDPCKILLDYKTFGQCHRLLDPSMFLEWCQKDTCGNHPELACASIEAYARDCASAGLCINWRNNLCPPPNCPSDKIYNPCGQKCERTCQNLSIKECPKIPVEGCFCPEGQVLRNDSCVLEKDCLVCDSEGHHPGDSWKKDQCTSCTCEGTSLKCETEHCSNEKICEQGNQLVKMATSSEECCPKFLCVPEPTAGPTCETPQAISCGAHQVMKLSTKPNGCQQFICECKPASDCPVIFPNKKELRYGFVEKVDTSGCCPEMKVVCDESLCPPAKQCPQFHILKNETTDCCPLYTCEAPKDKCIYETGFIAAENGGERERTEMEKQKLLKNANDSWHDGPCRQCKCVLTSVGNYQATCSQTDCSAIEISQDFLDYELIPEFSYDQCCPNIKRVACKHNEKIYKVGEKWKVDDFCTVFECVNASGVQKEKKVINCDTNCDLGFKYIESKTECCGSCKPVACVVHDKLFEVGAEWSSEDFCTKYQCLNVNGSMQIQSVKVTCPELSDDDKENFVFEHVKVEKECCSKHKIVACKVSDKTYNVGENWPSDDKCKNFTCVKNSKGEISKQELVETCRTDCSKGFEYQPSKDKCCGDCVRTACVVDNVLKQVGENWTSSDNCTTFTCEHYGNDCIVTSQQESCPSLEDCPDENIYVKGCCKHCNMTSAAQKQCVPEAIPLHKTIGLIKTHRENHGKCINKEPIKKFRECLGACESSTYFDIHKGLHESKCSCCQATDYESIDVELKCEDGYVFKKTIAVPSECGCEGCAAAKKFTKSKRNSHVKS